MAIAMPARQSGWSKRLTRHLSWLHRWLGIVMCLFFAAWFVSGAIMLYVPFPSLSDTARYRGEPPVDVAAVTVSPAAAIAASGLRPEMVRLIQGRREPVFIIGDSAGRVRVIDAVTGKTAIMLTPRGAALVAARFSHRPVRSVAGPYDYDEWIVHQHFNPGRPFYRVALADARGTDIYVSAASGEVWQRTSWHQRAWNWAGAVVHWVYPTIIRRHYALWDNLVWCVALLGVVLAVAGLTLGVVRMRSALHHSNRRRISAFRGVFRWHHLLGLTAGVTLCTWIFSGWLSVDHGRLFSTGIPARTAIGAVRGIGLGTALLHVTPDPLAALRGVSEIDYVAFAGAAYLIGHGGGKRHPLIVPAAGGSPMAAFPNAVLARAVRRGWPDFEYRGIRRIAPHDWYANLPDAPLPPQARRVFFRHEGSTIWIDIDAVSGQVVDVVDGSRRVYLWLFDGLHTFDIPGLPEHPFLQKLLMLTLLAGGLTLSVTSIVLASRRLRRL